MTFALTIKIYILFAHAIIALTESYIKTDRFFTLSGLLQVKKWLYVSIIEFRGLLSLSLDVSETGESTKCLWVGVLEGMAGET